MPAPVNPSFGPPPEAWTIMQDYASGSNPVYVAKARSIQNVAMYTVTSVSTAAAAVFTIATPHGLNNDNAVTIAGATGDWAAMNGVNIVTRTGDETFTIPVNSTGFAGTFNGTVTTTAPRTSAPCWSIQKLYYTGDANTRIAWCAGSPGDAFVFDSRASYSFA